MEGQVNRCRFCAAVVVFDDERHTSFHPAPVCDGWKELLAGMVAEGLMKQLGDGLHQACDDVIVVNDDGRETSRRT
jgi:hypothetical protein